MSEPHDPNRTVAVPARNEPHDPSRTVDVPATPAANAPPDLGGTVDVPSAPADSLDAGLAAGFGRPLEGPRSGLDASLRPVLLKEAEGESAHVVKPKSDAMPPPEQTGDRYQLQGEIARGGMGAVLRGRDVDLGRDLAVKVLLERHADRPEVVRRFLEEAQIGGQLQHPGVVPVYDVGRFGERPFFTMKLVQGKTLAALMGERSDLAADRPRFLAIALQVAQTLAYAHNQGVIHRDLKPANIMVGAFGEVQVMDWGLAKVLQEGGSDEERAASRERVRPEDGTTIRTARSSGSTTGFGTHTEAGTLLGTPAYMPPEQAQGDVANLDRRADVFGLGALLCEVLTGKPPYVGRSYEEVRRQAASGDLADALARLDACGADGELIVLTRACLSPRAADRPRDALAVAEALTAYQGGVQDRLHQAELARAAEMARAKEAQATAAQERRARRLTLALAATVLLALTLGGSGFLYVKAQRDARQAQVARDVSKALNEATACRERAKEAKVGSAALFGQAREQAQRARALVENGPADPALLDQVTQLQAELDEEEKDRDLLAALDAARLAQAQTVAGQSRFASEKALPLFRAAFRAYGLPAGEGEPADAAARIRGRPEAVRDALLAALDEWTTLTTDRRLPIREPHWNWLRDVFLAAEPQDSWIRRVWAAGVQADETRRRAALQQLTREADVRKLPVRYLLRLASRLRAVEGAKAAVPLLRRARQQYPGDYWLNYQLGMALQVGKSPDLEGAVRYLSVAVALRPDSPGGHVNLGNALADKGKVEEAIACFRKAIDLEPKYAAAHSNLGRALNAKGAIDEAIACHRQAIVLDPKLAPAHLNLGNALSDKGQVDAAIASYGKAIELDPNLAAGVAQNLTALGNALSARGRLNRAIACYHMAIELDPTFARAHGNLGATLQLQGKVADSIACCKKAIELDPTFAEAHANLGMALDRQGQVDEAIASYQKAVALDPKLAKIHYNLGGGLRSRGRLDEAIASLRKAVELDPGHAEAYCNLGQALIQQGRFAEALKALKRGHELGSKRVGWPFPSGLWVARCQRQLELDGKLAAVLAGTARADSPAQRLDFARLCALKKQHAAAARFYAEVFALEPKRAEDLAQAHRYNAACSAALAAAGQGKDGGGLTRMQRLTLRRRALTWLRADLTLWTRRFAAGEVGPSRLARLLAHWHKDADLAGIRDEDALARLPVEERAACDTLWADVAALLKKSQTQAKKEGK